MEKLNIFIPITKVDVAQRLVYGVATAEKVDKSGEIMDYESTLPFYKAWSDEMHKASGGKSYGNVREMHDNIAAGKLMQINFDDAKKQVDVCAKIIDDSTWNKVLEGVLTGFSHGGEYVKRWKDDKDPKLTRYTAKPVELSVVDNPCLGAATFEMIRADGSKEMVKFKTTEPEKPKFVPEQVWKASDGTTFAKKDECLKYEGELEKKVANPTLDALNALSKALDDKTAPEPGSEEEKIALAKKEANDKEVKEPVFKPEFKKDMEKGMSEVARTACLIQDLHWLVNCLAFEAVQEGDGSKVPDHYRSILIEMLAGLELMVTEEVHEMTEGHAAELMGSDSMEMAVKSKAMEKFVKPEIFAALEKALVEKAGARHSAVDKAHLGKALGHLGDAEDHHEDAVKAHVKVGESHDAIRKSMEGMQDCMKAISTEQQKKLSGHLDEMDGHMDKAEKHHGKIGKAHDGMAKAHEGIGESLAAVGAEAANPHVVHMENDNEKTLRADMQKLTESVEKLTQTNEELATKNADHVKENAELNKTLGEVNKKIPELLERVNKLEKTPLPPKGALYDAGAGGSVQKGHGVVPENPPVETQKPVRGLSPEAQRQMLGIK